MTDPERIWLQSYEDTTAVGEDRLWCEDKVWPANNEDHEPTEYVRADRISQQDAELERLQALYDREKAAHRISVAEAIAEARKAAFIEAAEIAETIAKQLYQGELPRGVAERLAAKFRAKAEETRT